MKTNVSPPRSANSMLPASAIFSGLTVASTCIRAAEPKLRRYGLELPERPACPYGFSARRAPSWGWLGCRSGPHYPYPDHATMHLFWRYEQTLCQASGRGGSGGSGFPYMTLLARARFTIEKSFLRIEGRGWEGHIGKTTATAATAATAAALLPAPRTV
jgi:hypothetical protein